MKKRHVDEWPVFTSNGGNIGIGEPEICRER